MREILFRGKRLDNNAWAEGYLFDDGFTNSHRKFIGSLIITDNIDNTCNTYNVDTYFYEVHQHTVGQWTEMYDKNNQKIFEGDIVCDEMWKGCGNKPDIIGVVVFKCGCFGVQFEDNTFTPSIYSIGFVPKVIGNIFDNPELMEKGS